MYRKEKSNYAEVYALMRNLRSDKRIQKMMNDDINANRFTKERHQGKTPRWYAYFRLIFQ